MNKVLYSFVLYILCSTLIYAQSTNITVELKDKHSTPIVGATTYFETSKTGALTDINGVATLENVSLGEQILTIYSIGFDTIIDTIQVTSSTPIQKYTMHESNVELEGVTIQTTRSTRTIKNIPTRVEFIGGEELGEKALMNAANISMVLRESTGIQIQQTSLSSVNSSIRIQGLDGRYTQILKDGFPLFGGFSGGLSINQIPPLDLQQFEIIKGSASTLYGAGAIAGLVNLISKTPTHEPKLDIQLAQTHVGGSTANVFFSKKKEKIGYTLYGSGHYQNVYDPNNDDFSNLPQTKTISFNPKLFYYPSKKEIFWLGLNGTFDQREGGDVIAIKKGNNGIHQYIEENTSTRLSTQVSYQNKIDTIQSFQVKGSVSYFDRELTTPNILFSGEQLDIFSEANYSIHKRKTDWIFGGNFYNNSFTERDNLTPRNQTNTTFGGFMNNITDLSNKFILESGFRADYVPNWGVFPLPRISLLWKTNKNLSSRLGGGLGYKIPDIFTEEAATINFNNILPIDANSLDAERSYGANIDFNYANNLSKNIRFSINQLFYLTSIDNALLLSQQSNENYVFGNADGIVLSRGAETNIKFSYNDFRWFLNYAHTNTTLNYLPDNPQKTLTPKHQAGSVLMYENEKWRIGYEVYYTGSQRLSSGQATPDFFTMGLLVQKHFKWGSPYINFENFTDRKQSKFSPETLPPHQNPQFSEIYAPTDGFVFTAGIIINPFGMEHHHEH
ncbi:MAG: TonB-dependent receptor [Cytophagales bacterium]|nr:TonB-dependent receptor [Cytophagales bacterium]